MHILWVLAGMLGVTGAIDCSARELSQYDFASLKGVYSANLEQSTPPSITLFTWHLAMCKTTDNIEKCPKDSGLCGLTTVSVGETKVVSEVIGIKANYKQNYEEFDDDRGKGITVLYKGVTWGDFLVNANVDFVCSDLKEPDLIVKNWTGTDLQLVMRTKSACVKGSKAPPKEPGAPAEDNGESWGWFTWIFIFMVLFLSIYIIGGAWFQYNKGNAIDFSSALKEVLENVADLLRGMPAFFREIVERVTGGSSRGEYSAV